jgi:hypothetical protein
METQNRLGSCPPVAFAVAGAPLADYLANVPADARAKMPPNKPARWVGPLVSREEPLRPGAEWNAAARIWCLDRHHRPAKT